MINRPYLKKIVATLQTNQQKDQMLQVVETLLVFMKKFGKHLVHPTMVTFLQQHYPEVYSLLDILGMTKCTIKDCLLLRQYIRQALGEELLIINISHDTLKEQLNSLDVDVDMLVAGQVESPLLMVSSASKIYKRSLQSDLKKLL